MPALTPPGVCRSFRGVGALWDGIRWPPRFWELVLTEVVVVAIPEESSSAATCTVSWRSCCRRAALVGRRARLGPVLSSLLFRARHLAIEPAHIGSQFLPGAVVRLDALRHGSIVAGSFTHALSNLLMKVLAVTYFHG